MNEKSDFPAHGEYKVVTQGEQPQEREMDIGQPSKVFRKARGNDGNSGEDANRPPPWRFPRQINGEATADRLACDELPVPNIKWALVTAPGSDGQTTDEGYSSNLSVFKRGERRPSFCLLIVRSFNP